MYRKLLDLPDELLREIVEFLDAYSIRFVRALIPLASTCRRLRAITAPLLFQTISLRLTDRYVDKQTINLLINLCEYPETFACHIKSWQQDDAFCFREDGCEQLKLDNELVYQLAKTGLSHLTNVDTIHVGCLNSPILGLLSEQFPNRGFLLKVETCACAQPILGGKQRRSISKLGKLVGGETKHQLALRTSDFVLRQPLQFLCMPTSTIKALSFKAVGAYILENNVTKHMPYSALQSLEELHIQGVDNDNELLSESFQALLTSLPCLKLLSVQGATLCSGALSVADQLVNLESLRLNSNLDRIFHAHLRKREEVEGLTYINLPKLKSLEIRYISHYLSIERIVPKRVEHLRIQHHRNETLTTQDILYIAKQAPGLRTLELNTGALTNLWHPTAIAGVDIDMEIYRVLDALSNLKHLEVLRLYPSYWQSTSGYLHFAQPVADEQAVRIFNHLLLKCQRLKLLIISSSHLDYAARQDVYSRGQSEPVKWTVRRHGSKTLLSTQEAKKHYHLEQIWEGERRLTMTNVRHRGRRPHFDDLQNWTLPDYEFPFDEPQACHAQMLHDGFAIRGTNT